MASVSQPPASSVAVDLLDACLEQGPPRVVRATVEVRTAEDPPLRAWVRVLPGGQVVDIQTLEHAGTTGDPDVDRRIGDLLRRELVHARSRWALLAVTWRRRR
jgi:hypothetical protein